MFKKLEGSVCRIQILYGKLYQCFLKCQEHHARNKYMCSKHCLLFKQMQFPKSESIFLGLIKKALRQACLRDVSRFSAKPATVFPAVRIPADENLVLFRRGVHDCRVGAEGAVLKPLQSSLFGGIPEVWSLTQPSPLCFFNTDSVHKQISLHDKTNRNDWVSCQNQTFSISLAWMAFSHFSNIVGLRAFWRAAKSNGLSHWPGKNKLWTLHINGD